MSAETDRHDQPGLATSGVVIVGCQKLDGRAAVTSAIRQVTHELHTFSTACNLVGCQHH